MQLKRATDILLRIFVYLASHPDEDHVSIHDLSEALNWNKNLVIKVAHLAVQQGYLKAVRGRTGGVSLAKPAREYRVGDIVRLTEVNEELVECDEPRCPFLNGGCRLRGVLANAREAFYRELNAVTLDQIVTSSGAILLSKQKKIRVVLPKAER